MFLNIDEIHKEPYVKGRDRVEYKHISPAHCASESHLVASTPDPVPQERENVVGEWSQASISDVVELRSSNLSA